MLRLQGQMLLIWSRIGVSLSEHNDSYPEPDKRSGHLFPSHSDLELEPVGFYIEDLETYLYGESCDIFMDHWSRKYIFTQ